jgi:hypothetical protein
MKASDQQVQLQGSCPVRLSVAGTPLENPILYPAALFFLTESKRELALLALQLQPAGTNLAQFENRVPFSLVRRHLN